MKETADTLFLPLRSEEEGHCVADTPIFNSEDGVPALTMGHHSLPFPLITYNSPEFQRL